MAAARRAKAAARREHALGITDPTLAPDSTRHGVGGEWVRVQPDGERDFPLAVQSSGAAPSNPFGGGLATGDAARQEAEDRGLMSKCWVAYRCLQLRADGIMSLPPVPTRGRGKYKQPVTSGRLVDLLTSVNSSWDFPTLMAMTDTTVATSKRGAFWVLDGWDEDDKPTEIWWAPPERMTVVPGASVKLKKGEELKPEDRYVSHYMFADGSKTGRRLERREVVWFRVPDPANEFGNLTPFDAMSEPARLAMFALAANGLIFQNGLTGAGIISPEDVGQPLTPDQSADIQELLRAVLKGRDNFHKVLVLNKPGLKYQRLDFSPKDAQFIELLGVATSMVCIAAGVPLPLVEPTDSTFANVDGARGILWTNTLLPLCGRYAATIREQLVIPHFPEEADGFEFDSSGVPELQESANQKAERDRQRLDMVTLIVGLLAGGQVNYDGAVAMAGAFAGLTPEEARAIIPAPVAGSGDNKAMAVGALQQATNTIILANAGQLQPRQAITMLVTFYGVAPDVAAALIGGGGGSPGGQPAPLPTPATMPRLPAPAASAGAPLSMPRLHRPGGGRGVLTARRRVQGPPAIIVEGRLRHVPAAEARDVTLLAHARKVGAVEDAHLEDVQAAMARMLGVQRGVIVKGLASLSDDDLAAIVGGAESPEAAARALASKVFPRARMVGAAASTYGSALAPLADEVARQTIAGLGRAAVEELMVALAPDLGAALLIRGQTFANLTADSGWADLARIIARSLAESGGDLSVLVGDVKAIGSLAYVVSGHLADINDSRAALIARTEVHSAAQNIGLVTARAAGGAAKKWLTAGDGLVRSEHVAMHGAVVPIGGDFDTAVGPVPAPGMSGVASFDIGCRCQTVYLSEDEYVAFLQESGG